VLQGDSHIEKMFTMTHKNPATPAAERMCIIPRCQSVERLIAVATRLSSLITGRAVYAMIRPDYEWSRQSMRKPGLSRGIDITDSG